VSGQLVSGQLVSGQLVRGQLVSGQLVRGQMVSGQLVSGQLVPILFKHKKSTDGSHCGVVNYVLTKRRFNQETLW